MVMGHPVSLFVLFFTEMWERFSYGRNSPITYAKDFDNKKNKFLLIHGMADDNVHVQNAMDLADALIMSNKQFEMMIYPDKTMEFMEETRVFSYIY